ncbi:MAG: NAD-dependent epimerase/dehydratase family protein [Planctomycetaceae bacterium]
MSRPKVLITGASGLIAGLVLEKLSDKYEFSGLSRRSVPGIPHCQASITDAESIRPAFVGMDMVLHLGAATGADEWLEWGPTMAITVHGTLNVYEAARLAGVKRIVFASSGSCQLGWEWDDSLPYGTLANGPDEKIPNSWPMVELDWPVRPDSPYAVGKLFGEHLGRYYADKYGISTLVIRLGAVLADDKPAVRRHFPGFLSQSDCVQMIDKCLSAPESIKYDIFNAISENKYRWRSTDHAKEVLGWKPTGSAETASH